MVSAKVIVNNEKGIHLRTAGIFCEEAMKFKSHIDIKCREKCLNGKSILGVLAVGVKDQDEIEIICTGEDEADAIETLVTLVKDRLNKK